MSDNTINNFPKHDFLFGIKMSSTTVEEVLKIIQFNLKNKHKIFITTPNPEILLQAQKDEILKKSLNRSSIAVPDGIGLLWGAKRANFPLKLNRIPGRVLLNDLILLANRKKYKIFLLGADEKTNEKAVKKLQKQYPKLKIAGTGKIKINSHGKGKDEQAIKMINEFKPHMLFVALGAPKQEKWIVNNMSKVNAGLFMTVGGSIDTVAGTKALPPLFISKAGLEWLWRLVTQPSRVGRVFNAVVKFPLYVLKNSSHS